MKLLARLVENFRRGLLDAQPLGTWDPGPGAETVAWHGLSQADQQDFTRLREVQRWRGYRSSSSEEEEEEGGGP